MRKFKENEKFDFVLGDDYSFIIAFHERLLAKQELVWAKERINLRKAWRQKNKELGIEIKRSRKIRNREVGDTRYVGDIISQEEQAQIRATIIDELTKKVCNRLKIFEENEGIRNHEKIIKMRQDLEQELERRWEEENPETIKVKHRHRPSKNCIECGIEIEVIRKKRCLRCYRKMRGNEKIYVNPVKIFVGTDTSTEKEIRKIQVDILEGLTENQKAVIKWYVGKGYMPLGFSVDVEKDKIYYMGNQI